MIRCISGSLGSPFWCKAGLFEIMLCFAVSLVQQMTWYVIEQNALLSKDELDKTNAAFWSVHQGTFSLFSFFAGGAEWSAYQLVEKCGAFASVSFVIYIILMWISLNNIIAGIYLRKVLKYAQADSDDQIKQATEEILVIGKTSKEIFKSMDEDCSGALSLSELRRYVTHSRVVIMLSMQRIQEVTTVFETVSAACGSDKWMWTHL